MARLFALVMVVERKGKESKGRSKYGVAFLCLVGEKKSSLYSSAHSSWKGYSDRS